MAHPRPMHWMDHLNDLRRRLIITATTVLVGAVAAFSLHWPKGAAYPTLGIHNNLASQAFAGMAADLVPDNVRLVVVRPMDGFLAEMTIAFAIGFTVALPVILWQIGGFLAPALRDQEKRLLAAVAAPIVFLFLAGAAFAYKFVLPLLLKTLYGYGDALGAQPLLQVSEFIGFSVGFMVVLGLAFQTPLVMVSLSKVGLVAPVAWAKGWRHAIIAILVLSAFITDPTIVSQMMVAGPLVLLYGLGVAASFAVRST